MMETAGMASKAGPFKLKPDLSDPWDAVKLFGKFTKQVGSDASKAKAQSGSYVVYSRESGSNFLVGPNGVGYLTYLEATDTTPKEKSIPFYQYPLND